MRISVIIPTYNSAGLVPEAVDSALAQSLPPAEIIVVDDGSQDETGKRLEAYGSRIRYVYQANAGVAAARNHGLRLASGDAIAFLDADDVWHPAKLEMQSTALAARPDLGLLATRTFAWPQHTLPEITQGPGALMSRISWEKFAVKNRITTSSVLVRRSVLQQVGEFDTSLHGPEDYDLWLRIAEVAPIAELQLPLTGYRMVPGSLGKQPISMEAGMLRILRKMEERGVWRGRWLLRRRAAGYCRYSCGMMYEEVGSHFTALARLLGSFTWYPLPYSPYDVCVFFGRPKLAGIILLRLLRLKPLHRPDDTTLSPQSDSQSCPGHEPSGPPGKTPMKARPDGPPTGVSQRMKV